MRSPFTPPRLRFLAALFTDLTVVFLVATVSAGNLADLTVRLWFAILCAVAALWAEEMFEKASS